MPGRVCPVWSPQSLQGSEQSGHLSYPTGTHAETKQPQVSSTMAGRTLTDSRHGPMNCHNDYDTSTLLLGLLPLELSELLLLLKVVTAV
jgi:hypothetical protein